MYEEGDRIAAKNAAERADADKAAKPVKAKEEL